VPGVDALLYQAADPSDSYDNVVVNEHPAVPYKAVPLTNAGTGDKVIVTVGWFGSSYGLVKQVPQRVQTWIKIVQDSGTWTQEFSAADTAPFWTGPTAWDQWWDDWLNYAFAWDPPLIGPFLPFNPKASAGYYWNHLYMPVGPFPAPGLYHLYMGQVQVLPVNDQTTFGPDIHGSHAVFHKGDLSWDNYPDGYSFWVE
jgi:hypothetical protein